MEAIQMYKTSDGQVFGDEQEAAAHEALIGERETVSAYRAALMDAGHSKSQVGLFVRGHTMFVKWEAGGGIPAPEKRAAKKAEADAEAV